MARPVKPKPLSEHVSTLARMAQQLEVDDTLSEKHRRELINDVGTLIVKFQNVVRK